MSVTSTAKIRTMPALFATILGVPNHRYKGSCQDFRVPVTYLMAIGRAGEPVAPLNRMGV